MIFRRGGAVGSLGRLRFFPLILCCASSAFSPFAFAQSCSSQGVAVQALGSGGPELQDKRASSSYLIWQDGRARVLVDAGGGSALRFGESGAQMSQLDLILFSHFHEEQTQAEIRKLYSGPLQFANDLDCFPLH